MVVGIRRQVVPARVVDGSACDTGTARVRKLVDRGTGSTGRRTPAYPGAPGPYSGAGAFPPYGYGQQIPYGAPATKKTNGLAIASLVCSCAGILFLGVPGILGIVFGFVARSQIRKANGSQGGEGLALAGIIVGFAWIAILVVIFVVAATTTNNNSVVRVIDVVHVLG